MPLTKLVNGQRIPMSGAEETAIQAQWTANAAAAANAPHPVDEDLATDAYRRVIVLPLDQATGSTQAQVTNQIKTAFDAQP